MLSLNRKNWAGWKREIVLIIKKLNETELMILASSLEADKF